MAIHQTWKQDESEFRFSQEMQEVGDAVGTIQLRLTKFVVSFCNPGDDYSDNGMDSAEDKWEEAMEAIESLKHLIEHGIT